MKFEELKKRVDQQKIALGVAEAAMKKAHADMQELGFESFDEAEERAIALRKKADKAKKKFDKQLAALGDLLDENDSA